MCWSLRRLCIPVTSKVSLCVRTGSAPSVPRVPRLVMLVRPLFLAAPPRLRLAVCFVVGVVVGVRACGSPCTALACPLLRLLLRRMQGQSVHACVHRGPPHGPTDSTGDRDNDGRASAEEGAVLARSRSWPEPSLGRFSLRTGPDPVRSTVLRRGPLRGSSSDANG